MAWWNDVAAAAESAAGWVGDGVEAVTDAVTEVIEEVTETVTDAANEGLDRARDAAAATSPALGAIANVLLGLVKGVVQYVQDVDLIIRDTLRNAAKLVSDLLHLNLGGALGDLLNLGINLAQVLLMTARVLTGGYFAGPISDYFARDASMAFIKSLIETEFGKKQGGEILEKLGWGTSYFRLPINPDVRIMRADSENFPFVTLHEQGVLDLFRLAGVASFEGAGSYFSPVRPRTRMVRVDDDGNDMWYLPVTRPDIRAFIDSDGTSIRLRAYAMEQYAAGKAMRTARKKFKKLCIDLNFGTSFNFATWQDFDLQPCNDETDFSFPEDLAAGLFFAERTPRDGTADQDGTPLCLGLFGYEEKHSGLVVGRDIKRLVASNGCAPDSNDHSCITSIQRRTSDYVSLDSDDDGVDDLTDARCGCGCTWRDSYPPWFSRLVLAHELGHYFGLAHAGHDGVNNIMFSMAEGNSIVGGGMWRWWSHGDAVFNEEDVEHAWRFIVKRMRHVLEAL